MILHRFGQINSGGYEFFGLDNTMPGILTMELQLVECWYRAPTRLKKMYDGLLKVKFLETAQRWNTCYTYRCGVSTTKLIKIYRPTA